MSDGRRRHINSRLMGRLGAYALRFIASALFLAGTLYAFNWFTRSQGEALLGMLVYVASICGLIFVWVPIDEWRD